MKLANYFQNGSRDGQGSFVKLTDDAPEWLSTAVHEAHHGNLPNDWIYAECQALAYAIDEGSVQDEDDLHMHVDGQVEVYTQPLMQWVADFCLTDLYSHAQEAAEDLGGSKGTIVDQASTLQYCAIDLICRVVFAAWKIEQGGDE